MIDYLDDLGPFFVVPAPRVLPSPPRLPHGADLYADRLADTARNPRAELERLSDEIPLPASTHSPSSPSSAASAWLWAAAAVGAYLLLRRR